MDNYALKRIWKLLLLLSAVGIGVFSLIYTNRLVKQLAIEEEKKIKLWAQASSLVVSPDTNFDLSFPVDVIRANTTIPVILTDENGRIISVNNLDTIRVKNKEWLQKQLEEMKAANPPIEVNYAENRRNYLYYKNSYLLTQLKQYPIFQLGIISMFILVSYFAFSYSRRSEQNRVWVGLAKETAHQLGTPISSLMAWLEYIKSNNYAVDPDTVYEMEKDLNRLNVITNRFSKIGSSPTLEEKNVLEVLDKCISYLKTRLSQKVVFEIQSRQDEQCRALVNVPLFEWVIENLCKNAVDAMSGEGRISFSVFPAGKHLYIDITDTGKGVPSNKFKTIFKPGYTTKRRGWGLGLSLVKRIIENYHRGSIFVKQSTLGVGTTFRIILKR